jgi:predicted ATPase/DNA-binding SARP family transcriptional activator
MDVRVLGPVEASVDGRPIALGGGKPRALLALLALNAGSSVSAARLIDGLWGEQPPATASKLVQVYVSQLRKALAASADGAEIVTRRHGYELRVGAGTVDAERFERLLAAGAAREALELWRGPPLDDVADEPFAGAEIRRLDELRLAALELAIEHDLNKGRHRDVIAELEALVAAEPLRERLHELLMLALYRSGRQADALAAYRQARDVLVEQLGLEPGPSLRELEQAILGHDPRIDARRSTVDLRSGVLSAWSISPAALADRGLPFPPNRTIGRDHDVDAVAERLRSGSVRLLTLTGPGGVGKTRLALESARAVKNDFADGAHFVSLAALTRPQDVPAAIVTTLEIIVLSGESPAAAVERFLTVKHLLLVVDNFEQILAAAPFIGGLLAMCPKLTVLATSREPLGLAAEERYPVSPLALPLPGTGDDPETLASVDAVALFSERARAHDPDFDLADGNAAVVAEICRRLDGLPLAIELAAARCNLLSPREIAERLDASLATLAAGPRDAPARQQTLRATIDWSHELLSDGDKACFAAFAVFAGGATVTAAETITGAELDTLDRLVAKSLLVRHPYAHAPTRLAMLETVRAHARERYAASADRDAVDERHYRYYRALVERHGSERALWGRDREQHLAQLDSDIDNLHAGLRWAVHECDAERALAMVAALGWYSLIRDRYADAVHWIDRALGIPGADHHPAIRAHALFTKVMALFPIGRSIAEAGVVAELEAIATALADPTITSRVLQLRARQAQIGRRSNAADALADEALHWAQTSGDEWEIARASFEKVIEAPTITELLERVDRAASLLDDVGNTHDLASMFAGAPYGALYLGSDREAIELAERAIPIVREHGTPYHSMMLCGNLGLAALMTGDTERATHAFREELTLCRELVVLPLASEGLNGLAALAAMRGEDDRAARLAGAAAAHRYGEPEDAVDARLTASFLQPARSRIGPDAWNAAVREGASLSFVDAIADALDEPRI